PAQRRGRHRRLDPRRIRAREIKSPLTVSLLAERHSAGPLPRLDGKEVLKGPKPEIAKIKGVIFASRRQFITSTFGEEGFNAVMSKVSSKTAAQLKTPLASAWYDFASLVESDRAMYDAFHQKHPNILALAGAASAEYGIGKVYKALDSA